MINFQVSTLTMRLSCKPSQPDKNVHGSIAYSNWYTKHIVSYARILFFIRHVQCLISAIILSACRHLARCELLCELLCLRVLFSKFGHLQIEFIALKSAEVHFI